MPSLQEKDDSEEIRDLLERINQRENNLEKELERTLELFKKMKPPRLNMVPTGQNILSFITKRFKIVRIWQVILTT